MIQELHVDDKRGETFATTMSNANWLDEIRQDMRQKKQNIEKAQKRRISLSDARVKRL